MSNIGKVRGELQNKETGALLITSYVNRLYASGFASSAGAMLITLDGAWFFTDSRYYEAAAAAIKDAEVLPVDREHTYSQRINDVLSGTGAAALGFEQGGMTHAEFITWESKLTARLVPQGEILSKLRIVKSREELAKMAAAQRLAETSFEQILPMINESMTERELANELTCRFLKNGADDKAFDLIVVSGVRSSMPHGVPTDKKLERGFLTLDFGVRLDGWHSDTTRTVCVGEPSEEMVRVYDTVLQAQLEGIRAARPGARGSEIHAAAARVIEDAGYGEYFGHGFGHGLGLEVHEAPNAAPSYEAELPAGAVISAEPGIYIPGKFGVRIEDVIYLGEAGVENLTSIPKGLIVI